MPFSCSMPIMSGYRNPAACAIFCNSCVRVATCTLSGDTSAWWGGGEEICGGCKEHRVTRARTSDVPCRQKYVPDVVLFYHRLNVWRDTQPVKHHHDHLADTPVEQMSPINSGAGVSRAPQRTSASPRPACHPTSAAAVSGPRSRIRC